MDSSIALYNNSWPIVSIIKFNHVLENNSIFSYKTNPECKIILYISNVCVCVLTQSCLPLCNPMDYSPPGSSVQGILQARILEWVAIPFSKGSSQLRDRIWSLALQADSLSSEPPGTSMLLSQYLAIF